jgi:hypothetical protein
MADRQLWLGNKAPVVDVSKHGHDHLAVEAVCHAAVPWDGIAKVLHFERTLEATREEAACDTAAAATTAANGAS